MPCFIVSHALLVFISVRLGLRDLDKVISTATEKKSVIKNELFHQTTHKACPETVDK